MRAAIYVRVSTEEQRDYGYSIDGQIRELKDYCKRKKYDVVDVYNDAGFSGKNMKRPNLERLLEDIKKNMIDVIVAIKVDRLTRDGYDGQWLLKECSKYDVSLDLLYEQYDINTANGEMMYGMNLLFAQKERKEIGNRTKRGLEEAVRQGKYPTRAPLGYTQTDDGYLVIDPVESLVAKDIFKLYASGMSMNAIAKKFEKENRYNKKNARWREDRILKIISNPIYKGELHWRRTLPKSKNNPVLVIPNHSPAIVSAELYDRCMEQLEKNKHGGYGEHIHIFQQVVKCPYCHKPMSNYFTNKQRKDGKKEFYYVICKNKICEGARKIYNTEKIENNLIRLFEVIAKDYKEDKYALTFTYKEKNNELDVINKALNKLKKDEQKLLDLYLESSINVDIINKKNESIQNEISKLEIKKASIENTNDDVGNHSVKEEFEKKDNDKLLGISNIWHVLDRKDKKRIISRYIKSIEIAEYSSHNIAITNVEFQSGFTEDGINSLTTIALECIKESNKQLKINKPTLSTKTVDTGTTSILDELKENKNNFNKFWSDIVKENSTIYPIYNLSNELTDLKVKVNPVSDTC